MPMGVQGRVPGLPHLEEGYRALMRPWGLWAEQGVGDDLDFGL